MNKTLKSKLVLLVASILLLPMFPGCKHELSSRYYSDISEVAFQKRCSYYPKGYRSLSDPHCKGVLAAVNKKLVFESELYDATPDELCNDVRIRPEDIDSVTVSDFKSARHSVLRIWTLTRRHDFYIAGAEQVAATIRKELNVK